MEQNIKMIELSSEYLEHKEEINLAIQNVLNNGAFVRGKEIFQFEENLANYLAINHVVSCGNGTDALQIALMALGIGAGDEVIIPAFGYAAVAEVICLLGAIPVFVDVEAVYYQINDAQIEQVITNKTKAIIPIHLFGQCANMDAVLAIAQKYNLYVIEDAAQALGAHYLCEKLEKKSLGGIGHIGCTSFFPTKNLACFGDGGALLTNDSALANKIRTIANHGQQKRYEHELIGVNSRLDTIQAAVLDVKLNYLSSAIKRKKEIALLYSKELKNLENIILPASYKGENHSWHQFTIRVKGGFRAELKEFLANNNIHTMIYYAKAIHQQTAYAKYSKSNYPIAEKLVNEVLSLPIHPLLKDDEVLKICNIIKRYFNV